MAFEPPFEFDSYRETRVVLKGVIGLLAVMVFGGVYMGVARHDVLGALGTLVVDALLVAFAVLLRGYLTGAKGCITREHVIALPERVWGVPVRGPVGTFAIQDFRAVRVERVLSSGNHTTTLHAVERVALAGRPGTPDVRVLSARVENGVSPGESLALALGLPCDVVRSPVQARWSASEHVAGDDD